MMKTPKKEKGMQAFPLTWPQGWPRTPEHARESGYQFTQIDFQSGVRVAVSLDRAYSLLREELVQLKAGNVVVSWNYRHDQYGFPIETEFAPKDQGVAVYFMLNGRPMVMACDRYQKAAANLRSLGLALEAMRQLARHGGGVMMERAFAGFEALPRPPSCWDVLGVEEGASRADIERAFRDRAKKVHPDAGGNDNAMAELNAARNQALKEIAA
jgi:DnaJ domain